MWYSGKWKPTFQIWDSLKINCCSEAEVRSTIQLCYIETELLTIYIGNGIHFYEGNSVIGYINCNHNKYSFVHIDEMECKLHEPTKISLLYNLRYGF